MNKLVPRISSAILSLALVSPLMAQDGPARFQQIVHFTVKPGMASEFEGIMKQYVEAAGQQGVTNRWRMFQQNAGGSPNHYHLVSAFNEWAARDAWTAPREMFVKTHGEKTFVDNNRRWAAAVSDMHTTISTYIPHLSAAGPGGIKKHYVVSLTEIRPEKMEDYRYAVHKIRQAQVKANGPAVVGQRFIEGNRWTFKSTTGFDSGADRDKWPDFNDLMSIYTDEERGQIMDKLRGATVSSRSYEVSLREDLSYTGPASSTN